MRCRLYLPGSADARVLDVILENNRDGDVRLDADRIVVAVADDSDLPAGCLVWRPSAFIHEFHVPPSLGQLLVAESLMRDSIRIDISRRHLIRQAHFLVDKDNSAMLRYLRDRIGAVEQNGILFTLNLKAPGANNHEGT